MTSETHQGLGGERSSAMCLLLMLQLLICLYFGVDYVSSAIVSALPKPTHSFAKV